ncbi:hypothetical protein FB451DRAFT_1198828 [Mycena latifolia]|nr:hypothetical protein FB451DRAFT_1198828 [Mycena latifolia]
MGYGSVGVCEVLGVREEVSLHVQVQGITRFECQTQTKRQRKACACVRASFQSPQIDGARRMEIAGMKDAECGAERASFIGLRVPAGGGVVRGGGDEDPDRSWQYGVTSLTKRLAPEMTERRSCAVPLLIQSGGGLFNDKYATVRGFNRS